MSHLAIFVTRQSIASDQLVVGGDARVNVANTDTIEWAAVMPFDSNFVQINAAIKDAAIAAAEAAGFTIGVSDQKTLFGGAVIL